MTVPYSSQILTASERAAIYETDAAVPLSPLKAARRWWPLTIAIVLAGLLAGVMFARAGSTVYTAEVRAAVGGQDVQAQTIAGFALGAEAVTSNYARYVTASQFAAELKSALGSRVNQLTTVTASPVPQSNVLRIITAATDSRTATQAADAVAQALKSRIQNVRDHDTQVEAALSAYRKLSSDVADAQTRQDAAHSRLAELSGAAGALTNSSARAAAQTEYRDATSELIPLQLQLQVAGQTYQTLATRDTSAGNVDIIGVAAVTSSDASARAARYGIAGGAVGFVAAMGLALMLSSRRSSRARPASRRRGAPGPG